MKTKTILAKQVDAWKRIKDEIAKVSKKVQEEKEKAKPE